MRPFTVGTLTFLGLALLSPTVARADPGRSASVATNSVSQVTLPAGTVLRVRVGRGFGSDISRVEDPVPATLARAVRVGALTVLPAGSHVSGYVVEAQRPGRVKGRGRVAVRFTRITLAGQSESHDLHTRTWVAVAPATKEKDAATIAIPAAGGALIGALVGGKKGAGVGALVGGGAGTTTVLATRGREVRIGRGATLTVRLTEPLTLTVNR
jgi:hypothetical protein